MVGKRIEFQQFPQPLFKLSRRFGLVRQQALHDDLGGSIGIGQQALPGLCPTSVVIIMS